jgi:hypothetical protein
MFAVLCTTPSCPKPVLPRMRAQPTAATTTMDREITEARIFQSTALANLRRTVPGMPILESAIRWILLRLRDNVVSHARSRILRLALPAGFVAEPAESPGPDLPNSRKYLRAGISIRW